MRRYEILMIAVSAILAAQAGAEPKTIANLGTLTCSLDPTGNDAPGLACVFEPIAGVQANFVGRAETDAADQALANMVFVWSVVAPSMETPAQNIEGRYRGDLTGEEGGPPTLIGGLNNEILLKPTIDRASDDSKVAIRTLELRLDAIKA